MATENDPGAGTETGGEAGRMEGMRGESPLHELMAEADLPRRMREQPYAILGAAAAAGYFLGGGLFSRVTRPLVRLALGALLMPRVRLEVGQAVDALRQRLFTEPESARS